MDRSSKILLWCVALLTILSVSATFYKTVILQDFDVTGVYVEFPTEDSAYVWFVYNNEEYELDLETSNYEEILLAVSSELGIPETELNTDFLDYLASAYAEGEVTGTEEEALPQEETGEESESAEGIPELGDTEMEVEATSTKESSDAELAEPVIKSEI